MQADRVWPMRGSGGEYAGQRVGQVTARVDGKYGSIRLMQPGKDEDLVANGKSIDSVAEGGVDVDPGLSPALVALTGSVSGALDR